MNTNNNNNNTIPFFNRSSQCSYTDLELLDIFQRTELQFLIPTLSIGNIGQLSMDLLLSTYHTEFQLLGTIYSKHFYQIVYNNHNSTGLGIELYYNIAKSILLLQFRSILINPAANKLFTMELYQWITEMKIKSIIVLTSELDYIRSDKELYSENTDNNNNNSSSLIYYYTNTTDNNSNKHSYQAIAAGLGWNLAPIKQPESINKQQSDQSNPTESAIVNNNDSIKLSQIPIVLGGGISRWFYYYSTNNHSNNSASNNSNNPLSVLFLSLYSSDSDNTADALYLTAELLKLLIPSNSIKSLKLIIPESWNYVFGPESERSLYL